MDNKTHLIAQQEDEFQRGGNFSAPLGTPGAISYGRLVFASGAAHVHLEASVNHTLLYAAHFEEPLPSVIVQDGIITLHYHRPTRQNELSPSGQPTARIALNTTIPWEIEFRNGISHLTADLHQVQLGALDMSSVSAASLMLPMPNGIANIYLSGSASNLTLRRPTGVALRLHIAGAASHLWLDDEHLDATHGGVQWQSRDAHTQANRYNLSIAGSVSNLTLATD